MERSGMLNPTCCKIVPRDRTEFEKYTTNLHYAPQLHKLFVVGRFHQLNLFRQSLCPVVHFQYLVRETNRVLHCLL